MNQTLHSSWLYKGPLKPHLRLKKKDVICPLSYSQQVLRFDGKQAISKAAL